MDRRNIVRVLSLGFVASIVALGSIRGLNAEIPNKSKDQLRAAASHAIRAVVVRTYERTVGGENVDHTYGVAELAVQGVDKGSEIAPKQRVFVRYWRKHWIGGGKPQPGHYGHRNIPQETDSVEVFVQGDRKSGFDVLSPNGFFKVTKATRPDKESDR